MKKNIILIAIAFLVAGCAEIQPEGSLLNQQISEGIKKNQGESEKLVTALAKIERAILDEQWENIYYKTEKKYIEKNSIANESLLTHDQRIDIASYALKAYNNILFQISETEKDLINKTRQNSKTLIEMNDVVTQYLISIENLDAAKSTIVNKFADFVEIDTTSIFGITNKLIGAL